MSDSDTVSCPNCGAAVGIVDAEPLARVPCPDCGERIRATRSYNYFELRETLGTGGMGTVYKAHDMQLDRDVALKLLRKDLGPEYANQLQHEARITASVNHPHVVQVFSFGRDHEQYYLVMELVDRGTLDDLIAERKKLTEEEVLRTGIEVARGLRAAYKKGLIHRDVKPANILFNDDGMAKISDFGLAGIVESHEQTSGGIIWGTPYYVAPERLNNQPEDFRSDIYSLGATLFHAAAGRPPFEGETTAAADLRALKHNPLKLTDVAPEVSRATATAIARMIAPDPRWRFHSHDAVIQALQKSERALRGESEPWRAKAALALAAATLFALVVFGWIFFLRPHAPAKPAVTASATLSFDVNREFDAGRHQILDGNYSKARATFTRLASQTKNRQPIYDWALLNQAIAALLDQQDSIMHQALLEVENAGTNNFADRSLGTFLLDIARRANARSAVTLSDIPDHAAKPFALFLLGLNDVQLGRFNDAEALLTSFVSSQPEQTLSWVGEYKPIARKYLADAQDILKWREKYGSAKTISEITKALNSLQDVIARLQKNTAISAEALLSQKTLAAHLRDLEAPNKSAQEKQRRDLLARETPQLRTAVKAYQRLVARYDFAGAAAVMRKLTVTEPSLKQTQNSYQNVADWLGEWKATLINDLNTHGYNGPVIANNTQYSGVAGASADKLRMKLPYGVAETDWMKVAPPSLLTISRSFATDADRQWRCGVFAWAIGQTDAAQKLLDAGSAAKPSYQEARKFFNQTKH
ncbi:MAG TPA: serine/threonine-protein kinase [Chthoniobacterales bacterium]|nr:serine/threonine-protein kinase [Chthoniobacterales bacterium]